MPIYTVKDVKPTGKDDPNFGVEYFVQFNEDPRTVTVNRKNPVNVGDSWDGTITESKWGTKFKKAPFVPGNPSPVPAASAASAGSPPVKPVYKDNSDGQRQGMTINNAANYVAANHKELSPAEWAKVTHSYASELYRLGDLSNEPVDVTNDEDVRTVLDTFAPKAS